MRFAEAILALALILGALVVGIMMAVDGFCALRRAARLRGARWELDEHSDGEQVRVLACKSGEDDLLIGAVTFGSVDFEDQLYEVRSAGRQRVYALNEET